MLAGLLFLLPVTTQAASLSNLTKIENIRAYTGGDDQVRIVVDAAGPVKYNSFVLSNPGRIAIDIKGAWLGPSVPKVTNINSDLVGKVRISQFDKETVRVVVEANVSKEKYKIFALGANKEANKSYRIVMDFGNLDQANGTVKAQVDDTLKKNFLSWENSKVKFFSLNNLPRIKNKQETLLKEITDFLRNKNLHH